MVTREVELESGISRKNSEEGLRDETWRFKG